MAINDSSSFADGNLEPRCPVVLVLDVSGSMSGNPITELNAGLKVLKDELLKDVTASLRVEVAIVTFGGSISLAHDFATMDAFNTPTLQATGGTPMTEGVEYALQLVAERKEQYKNNNLKYYQPWVWLMTDGAPNDRNSMQETAKKIHQAHKDGKLSFWAVGVEGADMSFLSSVAPPDRPPMKLSGLDFKSMFKWMSQSLSAVSVSKPGDEKLTKLPAVGWGTP